MDDKNIFTSRQVPANKQVLIQNLYTQTLMRLGEMLKMLKQGDTGENREKLTSQCQYLAELGKDADVSGWVGLLEIAGMAIANRHNSYETTTKLIIKELKQAVDIITAGTNQPVYVSSELQALVPNSRLILKDVDTNYEELDSPSRPKNTLERDLDKNTGTHIDLNVNDFTATMDRDLEDDLNNLAIDIDSEQQSTIDWFDDSDFEEDEESSTAVFLKGKGFSTETNYPNSIEGISDLFEHPEEDIDTWNKKNIVTPENLRNDWDLSLDTEAELSEGKQEEDNDLSKELSNLFNNFFEQDWESEPKLEKEQHQEIPIDFLAEEDDTIENFLQETLIEEEETKAKVAQLEEGEIVEAQTESPPLIYSNFDELESLIESSSERQQQSEIKWEEIFSAEPKLYYEQFEELETLIATPTQAKSSPNWQQLNKLIEENIDEKQTERKNEDENKQQLFAPESSDLSDLDRLLKQAQTQAKSLSSSTKTKWQARTPTSQASPKVLGKQKAFEQTMRVPVKQLDNLNNLIGEMVVGRNRLEEDQDRLRLFLDNLLAHVQNLSDVGARMQDLYERSLLEGALLASRERNQALVKKQIDRSELDSTQFDSPELDVLELDRFSGFHILSQEIIELIVRVRESTSDIQYLVDETDRLGGSLRQTTNQLQEEINKSRMVAFSQTADRLPRAVRDISMEYKKRVELKVEGREVLVDKMILEHLWDPLQQLVKNAITHGIEVPALRKEMGKSPTGTITIRTFLQGPQTVISVEDNGAGINPAKIKQKAIEKKLITPAQAENIGVQDIYEFLFHPGFSTKEEADKHAGRGVGLDIVRNKLNEIRGTVAIDSTKGQGTTFTIRLPLTLSIGKALCCLNDNARIAFPMDAIEDTKDYLAKEIQVNAQGQKCIPWHNNLLPFRPLDTLLTYNRQITRSIVYNSRQDDETVSIVILRGGNNLLAIEVDQVLGQEEIVIKQISGPLPKPKGISGATVRSDGTVMPIGDVIELIGIAQGTISKEVPIDMFPTISGDQQTLFDIPVNVQPMVLIVDDSITVREMLSISFSKAGYRVEQARDGQEAWQKLRSGLPCDLVFCDIEMPRMNGLELLQKIEENEDLADIPVAILSSRGTEKHQQIAASLGASAYLIKPYVEKDLLDSAARMIKGEVLLAGSTKVTKLKTKPVDVEQNQEYSTPAVRKAAPMVLIIDDSVVVREMLSMTFKKAGYQVEQARDGQDAWDKVSSGLPCDILLCDIEMPRMNGLEFLARMQQNDDLSNIPVAMVTSRGAEKHRKIAAELGAKAYFTKPYLEEELIEATERLIQGEILLKKPES